MEAIFPPVPASLALARQMVGRIKGVPPAALDSAKLVLTELLANEIKHGHYAPGESLCCSVNRGEAALRVEVRHTGPSFEFPRKPDRAPIVHALEMRETGWGLALITLLADRWGVGESDGSRFVWAEVGLHRSRRTA
jgi:anti-sigma regulatory factor (Ser/Thr protein kinase)